jgi:hypothetical protein
MVEALKWKKFGYCDIQLIHHQILRAYFKECEINGLVSDPRNKEMREFFDDLGNERGPIDPLAAYCGGEALLFFFANMVFSYLQVERGRLNYLPNQLRAKKSAFTT